MKSILFIFSYSIISLANANTPAPVPTDYAVLVMGLISSNSFMSNYNKAKVAPTYTCTRDYVPERVVTRLEVKNEDPPKQTAMANEFAFKSDENPNTKESLSQGCIQGPNEIIEKCFAPLADRLRKGQIKMADLATMPHEGFHIRGYSKEADKGRAWEFHHQNRAKQDTGITVFDGYHYGKGSTYATEIMFFPRKRVPNYQVKGDLLEVTLANGEIINYNSSTGVIKSGVLSENKVVKGKPGEFKYDGSGIMIQMAGIDGNGRSYHETAKHAVITKKGFPPCRVPATELWPKKNSGGANNFKFATDEALDQWLKQSKCGFTL